MKDFGKIKKILTSQFEVELFEASLASLNDKANKLRYNNFAYSIRELSRHFLYSLSPEISIKKCRWYKVETADDKPTRNQRIKYSIQGGISDEILKKWGFDIDELKEIIKKVIDTINSLSKFTHINPEVFDLKDRDIDKNSNQVLESFENLVETIDRYREKLRNFLDGYIEEHMISSVIFNFFENIDKLAPHHSLNFIEVSDYHISEITEDEIVVNVSGYLHVTLEYGSGKERREGDGLDLEKSFPYDTKIKYEISEDFPSAKYEIDDFDADTSDWYGDYENE